MAEASKDSPAGLSFLPALAEKYMYEYQSKSRQCLQSTSKPITVHHRADKIVYENLYNAYMGEVGGWEVSATFRVNPEFYSLCDKLCSTHEGNMGAAIADFFKMTEAEYVLEGFDEVSITGGCDSAQTKQFEHNLISLTNRVMN